MRQITRVLIALSLTTLAGVAQAQDRRVNGTIFGGFTMPFSEVRDHLGDGWNIGFGAQVNVTPIISIEGVYGFNGLGEKRISIPVGPMPGGSGVPTDFFADMNMQFGTGSVVFTKPEGTVRPYGLVGLGIYYRPVSVTTPGMGYVPGYCNPWWYVCYPGGFVPVDYVIGERSSTDFGMAFGGGSNFGMAFAELRYHYVWGPETGSRGAGQSNGMGKANGQFLQFNVGVRF